MQVQPKNTPCTKDKVIKLVYSKISLNTESTISQVVITAYLRRSIHKLRLSTLVFRNLQQKIGTVMNTNTVKLFTYIVQSG